MTVNAIAPGFVQTDTTRGADEEAWKDRAQKMARQRNDGPHRGAGRHRQCRGIFCRRPSSGWVTAQVLAVDGGRMDYVGR